MWRPSTWVNSKPFKLITQILIKDILVTHGKNFTKTRVLERAQRVIGTGLLTSNGEFHLRQRRLMQPIFSKDRVLSYGETMVRCAQVFSQRWSDRSQIDMSVEMLRLTLTIAGHTLFGSDIESSADDVRKAMTIVFEYFNQLMLPFAGLIEKLPLLSRLRFNKSLRLLDETVFKMIALRRISGLKKDDLLSKLLSARDMECNVQMTDLQIRDEVMTLFLAGHETTATWLTWTWYLLSQNLNVYEKFHEELRDVIGEREPRISDLPRLNYLRMVLAESLRLYPPVWTLTRRAISEYRIGDYVLPAGSVVGMSQYVMHRDSRYFVDPNRFEPLRWKNEAVAKRPKYTYFPFGGGSRVCIGEQFAWLEASLLLATLSQRWKVTLVERYQLEFQPLITLRPKYGMPMQLHKLQPATSLVGAASSYGF